MGNEMGNNNTSEFREEEEAKAEGVDNEVEANEVADFRQKEARLGSDDADRVNGNEQEQEQEQNKQASNQKEEEGERGSNLNTTLLALDEPTLEKTSNIKSNQHELLDVKGESLEEDDNKSPEECKEALELSLNNTCDSADCAMAILEDTINMDQVIGTSRGIDIENDEEREKISDFDMIPQVSEDPKSEKPSDFDVHQVIDTDRNTNKEDDGETGKSCNFDTITQVLEDPEFEKTSNFDVDQVVDIDGNTDKEDDGEREKCSNFDMIAQASEDPKSEKTSDFDIGQVIDIDRDPDKEDDSERGKSFNLDTITQVLEDPKSEKTSDFDVDQVIDIDRDTDKEDGGERETCSNFDRITQVLEDPKSEKTFDFDVDQVIDSDRDTYKEDDGWSGKTSNFDTITQVFEDPKSEKTSNFDVDQVVDTDRDTNKEDDGEREKSSNFDMITQASEDPESEKTSNFDVGQVIDINRDPDKEDDSEGGKSFNLDTITQVLEELKCEKTSDFDVDQVIDTDRDTDKEDGGKRETSSNIDRTTQVLVDPKSKKTLDSDVDQVIDFDRDADKEHDGEREKMSDFETLHVSEDQTSEKTSDHKSIQHEFPETRAESLVGSSDDGSSQESRYGLGFSSIRIEVNGHAMHTQKSTNVECIGAEADTNMEKKKGDLIESRSCDQYTMSAATNVDTKDEETAMELICHNFSCSPPEESLVIESPKSAMQVPKVEDRYTNLKEESQLREECLGIDTVVEDNIPTQSKNSNGVQEELITIGSHSKKNAKEVEVSPESVANNKNEDHEEDGEDSDGEYLEISEQGMSIFTISTEDCKRKNEETEETMEISTNNGHEAETREPEESLFEPVLGFQPQIHQKETSITFQNADSTDESFSAARQETEKSKKIPSHSPRYIQTASTTFTESKPSTNSIDEQSVTKLPFSTFGEEDQESPRRPSNESNSDNSIGHIEMRKSPSFNIDIQSEGRAEETEKIPLLYQMKAIENIPNLQEISFPNTMEKRVVELGRSNSEKSRASFPGFAKEKKESEMEFKAIDQRSLVVAKKEAKELPPPSPIRKGKRRTKSLIFGTCICCATAIN